VCKWTDKYPKGSEHWLFGVVSDTDPDDDRPLCFERAEWRIGVDALEYLEPEAIPLNELIEAVGPDRVIGALETYLKEREGVEVVPKNKHWSELRHGDVVEIDASESTCYGDKEIWSKGVPPWKVVGIEEAGYCGDMPVEVEDAEGRCHWFEIDCMVGVYN
tara:strand:- start:24657 stop:25139 length:483 start_codon:yes stop_codon:yes gene_type:complete